MVDSDKDAPGSPLVREGRAIFQKEVDDALARLRNVVMFPSHAAAPVVNQLSAIQQGTLKSINELRLKSINELGTTDHQLRARVRDVFPADELLRTAVRILILSLCRGLSATKTRVRQSPEAQIASQGLYAASEFFNREPFDPQGLDVAIARLSDALVPLAACQGCDPFLLHLYATGDLPWRRRRGKASAVRPIRGE